MADIPAKNDESPDDEIPKGSDVGDTSSTGPLDVPQEVPGDEAQSLEDSILARPSTPLRHGAAGDMEAAPVQNVPAQAVPRKSVSILRRRLNKFKHLKRGYYSFLILVFLYALSFALPLLVNNSAIIVHYQGETYFPTFNFYSGATFGQADVGSGEANYRRLSEELEKSDGDDWILMPLYHWNPLEIDFELADAHPQAPSSRHFIGTDDSGRDVFARMCYGFNISISFALLLTMINYMIGGVLGGLMGYFGSYVDLIGQRFVEIWSNIPFLYTVIIVSSIVAPNFIMLIVILSLFGWISISYYIRGEFLREKSKDYVAAAIALGSPDRKIIFKHILPNSLTPMIAFLPFNIIGGISALVALDFLGFGLPVPTPSWGEMVGIGLRNKEHLWLIMTPLTSLFLTLLLVTFIGEALREAFDPKTYSRLR